MTTMRRKSAAVFSVSSLVTSLLLSLLVFSSELKVLVPLVVSATVLAGSLGYIFGDYFSASGPNSKYKAMLLGSAITTATFVVSIVILTVALKIDSNGTGALFQTGDYLSEMVLNIGISGIFSAPILLPLGAFLGVYLNKTRDAG